MRMNMRVIAALLACGVAMGCQTTDDAWAQADASISACFKAMDEAPQLARVNAKFARHDPTPAQLADRAVPTDAEAAELRLRVERTGPCRAMRLAAVRDNRPLLEPAYAVLYYQADQVFSYLQQQAISYGTANQLSAQSLESFRKRERDYAAASNAERTVAANALREQLQAGHSAPPPTPQLRCAWDGLNVDCK
jgi:hypothetical protein